MLEREIEKYLCMLVYEDLGAIDIVMIEEKIKLLRRLAPQPVLELKQLR